MESDLGNVGVQRGVVRYERVSRILLNPSSWVAVLTCGHEIKLDDEPPGGVGDAGPGRYRDCPECAVLEQAEGA